MASLYYSTVRFPKRFMIELLSFIFTSDDDQMNVKDYGFTGGEDLQLNLKSEKGKASHCGTAMQFPSN